MLLLNVLVRIYCGISHFLTERATWVAILFKSLWPSEEIILEFFLSSDFLSFLTTLIASSYWRLHLITFPEAEECFSLLFPFLVRHPYTCFKLPTPWRVIYHKKITQCPLTKTFLASAAILM